jgi:hypothetical protein
MGWLSRLLNAGGLAVVASGKRLRPGRHVWTEAITARCHLSSLVCDRKDPEGPFERIGGETEIRHGGGPELWS